MVPLNVAEGGKTCKAMSSKRTNVATIQSTCRKRVLIEKVNLDC